MHTLWSGRRWVFVAAAAAIILAAQADPQAFLLNEGCSPYNTTNPSSFTSSLDGALSDLRRQLGGRRFATAQTGRNTDPVYAMAQCREYLSTADCGACIATAQKRVRKCSLATGGRFIYDGCFLRYESNSFFDQSTFVGNRGVCGNRTASQASSFQTAVEALLVRLQAATPKINGFFAASKQQVGSSAVVVYGVAQCAKTVSEAGCLGCLNVAHNNIQACLPNLDARAVDVGCFLRYSATAFFPDSQIVDLTPFLETGGVSKKKAIIAGVAGGVGLLIILAGLFVWYQLSQKSRPAPRGDILGATELRGPTNYRYRDLKNATNNFSEENKLGEGGFGSVYKGSLKNGKMVAVKKLTISQFSKVREDFDVEVRLISNVHHRNLIRLLGCCSKGPDLLLVYEYMANKSLDNFLFGEKRGSLDWKQRFDIIVGMARGLAYLHDEFHVKIIHRDIKSGNILLDDLYQPKIADFGLARLLPEDKSHVNTRFAGTMGYTAPEYALLGQLSEKVDIYGYGVVVLEIISGRKNSEQMVNPESAYLLEWAWKLYEKGMHLGLVDQNLNANEYDSEEIKKVIEIALMCTQSSVALRPTMSEVVVLLLSKGSDHKPQSHPIFIDSQRRVPVDSSTSTSSFTSNATASTSHISGR